MSRKLLVIALGMMPCAGQACSCVAVGIRKSWQEASVVFTGTVLTRVVSRHTDTLGVYQGRPVGQAGQQVRFTFLVQHAYKGTRTADTVSLVTTAGGADCGSNFLPGHSYLVYGWFSVFRPYDFTGRLPKVPPYLTTSICSRTKPNQLKTGYEKFILWLL